MKYAYANKKFKSAVTEMATSPKNIQERIGDAFINHLMHLEIEDLPEEIHLKFSNNVSKINQVRSYWE